MNLEQLVNSASLALEFGRGPPNLSLPPGDYRMADTPFWFCWAFLMGAGDQNCFYRNDFFIAISPPHPPTIVHWPKVGSVITPSFHSGSGQ